MSQRFVRCAHCKMLHDVAGRVCPTTGRRMPEGAATTSEPSRPERRPDPGAGFVPRKVQLVVLNAGLDDDDEADSGPIHRPTIGTLQAARNVRQDLVGRKVSDRYVVRGVLGEGGMGAIYEAEHVGLGRRVAIKVLHPSQAKKRLALKRFQQEARAAGAIGHPNICEVYDLGVLDDGSPFLVMEKLTGATLAERIAREGGLPFDDVADVMIQVLSGLIAAHDKGIVHRDIKPENIFLARRAGLPPLVKILDFGVSKMMPQFQGSDDLDLTRTGMVMGTPYYMSPEQARGERDLDGRVDIYAAGVVMYEAISGKRPFDASNYNALLVSIIDARPKPLHALRPATPPAMEAIVARMMAKEREDRHPGPEAALHDLRSCLERMRARMHAAHADRDASEGSGAALRSRMRESPRAGDSQPRTNASRLERLKQVVPALTPDSDSIEVPIHVTGPDVVPERPQRSLKKNCDAGEFADETPTTLFLPGSGRRRSGTRAADRTDPPVAHEAPPDPVEEPWDETVIRRPAAQTPKPNEHGPDRREVDIDFSDQTEVTPPPTGEVKGA